MKNTHCIALHCISSFEGTSYEKLSSKLSLTYRVNVSKEFTILSTVPVWE